MNMNHKSLLKGLKKDNMTEEQRKSERSKNNASLERSFLKKLSENNNTLTLTQLKMYRKASNSLNLNYEKKGDLYYLTK